jgi:hypothetical protein
VEAFRRASARVKFEMVVNYNWRLFGIRVFKPTEELDIEIVDVKDKSTDC